MQKPHIIANQFEIRDPKADLLGQGAMGQVYRGVDRVSSEAIAIKVLKPDLVAMQPDLVARFKREGEALRQLNHPNIVKMLAAVSEPDPESGEETHYLVMEYVQGGSLRELLETDGRLPVQRALQIGVELADALARAHHMEIIHRDIKPDNVLIAEDGTPRLTDFGIAHLADLPQLTQTGVIIGTVHYLSPEACNGQKLDARADIWAFGVMLFEMLAGTTPFSGENIMAVISAILVEEAPDLLELRPETPPALAELVGQMLAKEPDERIPSARFVAAQLEAIQKNQDLKPVSRTPRPKVQRSVSSPRPASAEIPQDQSSTAIRNQRILLEKVKSFWITGVLEKAAPDAARFEIAKRSANQLVERPWDEVISADVGSAESDAFGKDTTEMFYEADRSLLILGEPGAGKTITLLKLARSLIGLAESNSTQPIPVVLNFASWGEKRTPIVVWVTQELTAKYQIPRKMGRAWLDDSALILLLDDLDEVPVRCLPDAIRAINEFRENYGLTGIIIASRTEAYISAGVRLKFGGAVELQPLTPGQVDSYLAMSGHQGYELRAAIQRDPALAKIAQSPLWLSVMSISYRDGIGAPADPGPEEGGLTDSAIHRQRLIDSYIRYAFQRRSAGERFSTGQTSQLLSWLANNMEQHNQAIFLIEELQPSWLPSGGVRWVYSLGVGLLLGLTNAITVMLALMAFSQSMPFDSLLMDYLFWILLVDLPIGMLIGLLQGVACERAERQGKPAVSSNRQRWIRSIIFGLISAPLFLGALLALGASFEAALFICGWSGAFYVVGTQNIGTTYRNSIETVEAFSWSWKEALRSLIPGVVIGLVFALLTAFDEPEYFLVAWILWTPPWVLVFFLTGGLQGRRVEKTTKPNQGIWLSARNGIFVGGIVSLVLGVFFWLFQKPYHTDTLFAIFIALMTLFSLVMNHGISIVGHFLIRLLLFTGEQIPWALADFLDHAASLVLLRKVGGGYIFTHRMLLKYFSSNNDE